MRLSSAVLSLCLSLFCGAGAWAADASDAAATLKQFHQALHAGDADGALNLLTTGVQIYESGYAETRDQYQQHHLAADIAFAQSTSTKVSSTQVDCELRLCVITRQTQTSGQYKGRSVNSKGTETAVLRNTAQGWKIVHLHWSSQ